MEISHTVVCGTCSTGQSLARHVLDLTVACETLDPALPVTIYLTCADGVRLAVTGFPQRVSIVPSLREPWRQGA